MSQSYDADRSFKWTFIMEAAGWVLRLLPILAVALYLWYYLPGHDVVRIVDTDVKRMDVKAGEQAERGEVLNRDVRFINAVWPDGSPRVYRNEETGWGFPWYMKFDSQNMQAKAQNLRSDEDEPRWVLVTHYGWRLPILSMFPNALELEEVESPDAAPLVPWINVVFIVVLLIVVLIVWRLWRWFVDRHWLPVMRRLEIERRVDDTSGLPSKTWAWLREEVSSTIEDLRAKKR